MKRYLSLLLALLLVFSLAGCAITPQADPTQPETTLAPTVPPETTQPETTLPEQTQPPQQEDPVDPNVKKAVPSLLGKTADMATKILRTHGFVAPRIVYVNSYQEAGTVVGQSVAWGATVSVSTVIKLEVSNGNPPPATEPPTEGPTQPPRPEEEYPPQEEQPTDPPTEPPTEAPTEKPTSSNKLDPNKSYTSAKDVALFIRQYGRLPSNFLTKSQAKSLYGTTNGLNKYGKCIGGDRFYNKEGLLPSGYTYYECDIDTLYSSSRGAKRLVFTYSGLIYYTTDHYESFTLLYGNP